jgi:methylmalonyl-CoA mutase cobalamin-binding subunit
VLVAEGRAGAPASIHQTAFLRLHGVRSEAEFKRRWRDEGRISYHCHIGLSTWAATATALAEIHASLAEHGHAVQRFGLALDRAMGVPAAERDATVKETGPRLGPDDWLQLGEAAPIQPHLGDYMIGFPATYENVVSALAAGVTTIGNIGQYMGYDLIGGSDEVAVTEAAVKAIAAIAAHRDAGALVHSNLEDGTGMQVDNFGAYVGWAALELHVVETLLGGRLAHCFGNLIGSPVARAVVHLALDDLRDRDSIGSMVYGNTVDVRAGDPVRNTAVSVNQVMTDIAVQLRRPTGHAINPVPLTEAERIPSADEIVSAHLLARELEREVRRGGDLHDWARLERLGADTAAYARRFRDRALALLAADGVDVADAAQLLLALRRTGGAELARRIDLAPSADVGRLEPWKSARVREFAERIVAAGPRLDGLRVVVAVLEVHDVVRDALAKALPRLGAEVILAPKDAPVASLVRAAVDEDADAIVLGVYNGNAIQLAEQVLASAAVEGWHGRLLVGGILNQDTGEGLPIDARPRLAELGALPVEQAEGIGTALAGLRTRA